MPQTPSTRWCPTPEQLMILEEMYRSGVRTPNASQIQQITAHLALYGKIEGKNVFYWFQNHKARERQKLRRRLGRQHGQLLPGQSTDQGSSTPSSTNTPPLHNQTPHNFLNYQEVTAQGMNLVGKLEAGGAEAQEEDEATAYNSQPWMTMAAVTTMMDGNCSGGGGGHPCCRPPLKTLELFPTKSTGMKDEYCSSSKSSSCSTSTN
ncbi:hypothetical protein Cni_G05638 [Canna indica]|uniref:Homeobox domain-containing protein n=1 Tax=Canna indica TaxID=4628 RepID=A0AAQ3Q3E5_9LILI|nr:hypothetical protein Cni_G05638 [Canna indica]